MCSWGWGLFSESITNHQQTSSIFGRSKAVSLKLIFHGEQHRLPPSCISNFRMSLSVWSSGVWISDEIQLLHSHGLKRRCGGSWWELSGRGSLSESEACVLVKPPSCSFRALACHQSDRISKWLHSNQLIGSSQDPVDEGEKEAKSLNGFVNLGSEQATGRAGTRTPFFFILPRSQGLEHSI